MDVADVRVRVLEREPREPGGDRRDEEEPGQTFVRCLEAAGPQGAQEAADGREPIVAEIDEECDRGRDVQRDEKGEIERLIRRLSANEVVPPEPGGDEHGAPEARDWEQLGDILEQAITTAWK